MNNKLYLYIVVLLFVLLLQGCGVFDKVNKNETRYYSVSEDAFRADINRVRDVFINAIKESDTSMIKNEFSDYVTSHIDLDKELEKMSDTIDGNVVSIGNVRAYSSGSRTDENGDARYNSAIDILSVKTDKNKEYDILVCGIYYHREHPEKQGINYIYIYDNSEGDMDDYTVIGLKI